MKDSKSKERVLFYHPESDCYIEAIGEDVIEEVWSKDDGLLHDVTGFDDHEKAFAAQDARRRALELEQIP